MPRFLSHAAITIDSSSAARAALGDGCGAHTAGADPACVLLKTGGCGRENGIVLAAQQVRMYFSVWGKRAASKRASVGATEFNRGLADDMARGVGDFAPRPAAGGAGAPAGAGAGAGGRGRGRPRVVAPEPGR